MLQCANIDILTTPDAASVGVPIILSIIDQLCKLASERLPIDRVPFMNDDNEGTVLIMLTQKFVTSNEQSCGSQI